MTSETTLRANALVAERLPRAQGLGHQLAELIDYPDEFAALLREGLGELADEPYASEQERIAPGSGPVFGVRAPLIAAAQRQLRPALHDASPASSLWLAERLATEDEREFVFFAHECLGRSLPAEPEQSWQLMRRLARRSSDWIRVDSLASLFAMGILLEQRRWAELEQLIYSDSRWERRLVGSTIAVMPFELPGMRRAELAASPALALVASLIGDADQEVAKALAWALRSWLEVDRAGVRELIRAEAARAAADEDGNRAWVLRDALTAPSIERPFAMEIRAELAGIRRRAGAPPSSVAADVAQRFMSGSGLEPLTDEVLAVQGDRQRRAE